MLKKYWLLHKEFTLLNKLVSREQACYYSHKYIFFLSNKVTDVC